MSPGRQTAAGARLEQRTWAAEGRPAQPALTGWRLAGRRAARWGLTTAGRPLHRVRLLPGFIIAGAERCGTTSMFAVLRQHPAVFNGTLPRKEVHYFDNKYGRGLAWYRCHFPLTLRARLAARGAGTPVAFEATANYMFHPLAPGRIHRDLPGARLLVMVRDPVERAYSAHAHQVGFGHETESFERALELEDSRLEGEAERIAAEPGYESFAFDHHTYRSRGYYADQLDRLASIFGRDRIHVVDSGDFFAGSKSGGFTIHPSTFRLSIEDSNRNSSTAPSFFCMNSCWFNEVSTRSFASERVATAISPASLGVS